jgi:hypothetical protein
MKLHRTANARLLLNWNQGISAALDAEDTDALQALADSIEVTIDGMAGEERAYAERLRARAHAGLRYLNDTDADRWALPTPFQFFALRLS